MNGYALLMINYKMIYDPVFGIKANPNNIKNKKVKTLLNKSLEFFKKRKTDAIILGCTELPLILTKNNVKDMIIINSTECLAKALIRETTDQFTIISGNTSQVF